MNKNRAQKNKGHDADLRAHKFERLQQQARDLGSGRSFVTPGFATEMRACVNCGHRQEADKTAAYQISLPCPTCRAITLYERVEKKR